MFVSREFIAVPDNKKGQIVYKWPDHSIRKFTKAIVNADEIAYFVNTGAIAQEMGPGRHQIDAQEMPGLGALIDLATGGNAYRAELYFVATREFTANTFGGRIDDVQDPQTGLIVTLRIFGDYAIKVSDAKALILNLIGTVDLAQDDKVTDWVSEQLLKAMRTNITTQIVRNGWPILGLSAYTEDIEQHVIAKTNEQLASYGIALTRMGNFDINLSPEDQQQLKTLAKDTSYSRLAGGFNQYATGAMAIGAGQGMAQGGEGAGAAILGMGLGMGGMAAQQQQQPAVAPPPSGFAGATPSAYVGPPPGGAQPAAATTSSDTAPCPHCGEANPAAAKFCMSCGQSTVPQTVACANCGAELAAGAKFCMECGTPTA